MNDIVKTNRCHNCGATMEGRKGSYTYTECGLDSVVLKDITVFHCKNCNALIPEIPAAGVLHRVIALRLLKKQSLLTGREIRFLRQLFGYSVSDFVELMGVKNKTVVSRWENGYHGKQVDRTMRLLFFQRLLAESAAVDQPLLRNVTADQLITAIESTLRAIQEKEVNEKYEISPEELAKYSEDLCQSRDLVESVN
jgi:YgiT-type zinc finger domain-containing protein